MQNQSDSSGEAPLVILENLYPAILQSFAVILLGYGTSRWNFIPASQCRGFSSYISHFALPALLFQKTATLSFGSVDWLFWTSILVAKGMMFILVFGLTLIVGMPRRLGTAAIFSMFATQSNDFALGYPIFAAIYEPVYPELLQYIYLIGPISLICLNPFGFLALEVEKSQNVPDRSKLKMVLHVVLGMIRNPMVMSVLLGVVINLLADGKVPGPMEQVVSVLADSFAACALFFLGISLSGKLHNISGKALMPSILLISAKLFVLPLLLVLTVNVIKPGASSGMTDIYTSYGFLYGTIPTTPSVFIYTTQYGISQDIIASSLFLCTFLSGPLMFMTGTMAIIPSLTQDTMDMLLNKAAIVISCIGLMSSSLVLGIFILKRAVKVMPHQFTFNLVVSQVVITVGVITSLSVNEPILTAICQDFLLTLGILASRLWAMFIAIGLCILQMKKLNLLRWATYGFYLLGWGFPVALATTYFVIIQSPWQLDIATHLWQNWQVFGSLGLHLLCLIVILGALVTLSKIGLSQNTTGVTSVRITSQTESFRLFSRSRMRCNNLLDNGADMNGSSFGNTYYEIIEDPSTDFDGKGEGNRLSTDENLSQVNVRPEHLGTENEGEDLENRNHQLERHLTLMIVLVASVTVSLVVDVLKLSVGDPFPGVFVLLRILDEILTYGQGIFTLIIFGLKKPKVFTRLYNRICQIYDRLRHRRTGQ